jgi:hypothetical protein
MTSYGQLLLTLVFMMAGIQLENEPKSVHLTEVIDAGYKPPVVILLCKIIVIVLASFFVTALIICAVYFGTLTNAPLFLAKQSVLYIILLYFLPLCITGCSGILFAKICKGRNVYTIALLFWFCTSSLVSGYIEKFALFDLSLGHTIQVMLNLGILSMRYIQGTIMSMPVELPRFVVRISMFCAGLLLLFGHNAYRAGRVNNKLATGRISVVAAILCCAVLCMFNFYRYGTFFAHFADPVARDAYVERKRNEYIPGQPVSNNNFPTEKRITLEEANFHFSASTQGLAVCVDYTARADEKTDAQSFTLYSDIQVDGVWVDGAQARFERSNDGILVFFPNEKRQREEIKIRFDYHGYSLPIYPANETTVQLYRAFPWLPWPGIKNALKHENFYGYETTEHFFIDEWQRGDEIQYTLTYDGPGDLHTNLQLIKDNNILRSLIQRRFALFRDGAQRAQKRGRLYAGKSICRRFVSCGRAFGH